MRFALSIIAVMAALACVYAAVKDEPHRQVISIPSPPRMTYADGLVEGYSDGYSAGFKAKACDLKAWVTYDGRNR
jgi:hypothetical protein